MCSLTSGEPQQLGAAGPGARPGRRRPVRRRRGTASRRAGRRTPRSRSSASGHEQSGGWRVHGLGDDLGEAQPRQGRRRSRRSRGRQPMPTPWRRRHPPHPPPPPPPLEPPPHELELDDSCWTQPEPELPPPPPKYAATAGGDVPLQLGRLGELGVGEEERAGAEERRRPAPPPPGRRSTRTGDCLRAPGAAPAAASGSAAVPPLAADSRGTRRNSSAMNTNGTTSITRKLTGRSLAMPATIRATPISDDREHDERGHPHGAAAVRRRAASPRLVSWSSVVEHVDDGGVALHGARGDAPAGGGVDGPVEARRRRRGAGRPAGACPGLSVSIEPAARSAAREL